MLPLASISPSCAIVNGNNKTAAVQPFISVSSPVIVDFSDAKIVTENNAVTSASIGKIASFKGEDFYLKDAVSNLPISNAIANAITSREVVATKLYRLFLPAPEAMMVNQCHAVIGNADNEKIYIASKLVAYQDFGDCLIKGDLADDLKKQFSEEFTEKHVEDFKKNAEMAKALTDELSILRNVNCDYLNQPWWEGKDGNPNLDLVKEYQPKAAQLDKVIQKQLHLLPTVLQQQMQEHLAVSQLLGDWDPINAFYKNMGVVKDEDGQLRVMRLDFGSCLDVGFQGQAKENGYDTAVKQRPAAFPELKHDFKKESAPFSTALPKLAEQFDGLPYADHAKAIAGKAEWVDSTRMKLAYTCMLLKEQSVSHQNPIEGILEQNLMDAPGFMMKGDLSNTINARMDMLINMQCGGRDRLISWERDNVGLAAHIRKEVSFKLGGVEVAWLAVDLAGQRDTLARQRERQAGPQAEAQ